MFVVRVELKHSVTMVKVAGEKMLFISKNSTMYKSTNKCGLIKANTHRVFVETEAVHLESLPYCVTVLLRSREKIEKWVT